MNDFSLKINYKYKLLKTTLTICSPQLNFYRTIENLKKNQIKSTFINENRRTELYKHFKWTFKYGKYYTMSYTYNNNKKLKSKSGQRCR